MESSPVVLMVEDEPVCQVRLKALLERRGYQVRVAATGAQAVAWMACDPIPDAVILDLHLPDLSGFELCRILRTTHSAQELPILFMSADADIHHRAEGLRLGGSDYLSKPVDDDELAMRLGTHLALVARTREVQAIDHDWQQTFDALTDAVTLLDRKGNILKCNQSMARLVGLPVSGMLGRPCFELMHGLEGRIDGCPFGRMLETRMSQQRRQELNGRWHEVTVEPLWDGEGQVRGGVHRIRDIHDRVLAEEARKALLASERRLRAIFETTADGLVLLDKQTLAILDANPAFCRTYGYSVEELRKLTAVDVSAEPEQTTQATRGTESRVRGRLHRKKDGTVFPVDLTAGTFEEDGRVVSVVSSRDISEQVRAMEALRDSEERLELVLGGARLGFWDWDIPSGRVIRNARWAEMLGYTLEEVETNVRQWTDLHHPEDREAAWQSIQDHLEGRTSEHRIQYRMLAKDGSYRWILDQARVMTRDAEGRPLRMCGTHTDVTALKAVELSLKEHQEHLEELVQARTLQLESANQELEAFSYSVSHDLRAPLRAILGFSEALEEDFGHNLNEEARAYIGRIQKAGQRMGGLIEDLLRLSRVTRQECVMSPVDLSQLCAELCETLASRHPGHPVAWRVEPGLACCGDASLLRIALENLLANAWKFTGRTASPEVVVESGETGCIRVRDNGAGFPAEKASQLFTPFRRLHHEAEFSGTGLGLAMVRRILARHGGSITAAGQPGQGATFTLWLPRLAGASSVPGAVPECEPASEGG